MVFGGSMHPDQDEHFEWLAREAELLARVLEEDVPVLGVCLGAQLVARAAGAAVGPVSTPEIGWHEIELTQAGIDDPVLGTLAPRDARVPVALVHVRAAGRRRRARPQRRLHAGVPARPRVGDPVPCRGHAGRWWKRGPQRTPPSCRCPRRSSSPRRPHPDRRPGTRAAARLCGAFLDERREARESRRMTRRRSRRLQGSPRDRRTPR